MFIGIDIGGTAVKIGFINKDGDILRKWEIPTNKENQGEHIVDDIWNSIRSQLNELQNKERVLGIGAGAPGFVNKTNGVVYQAVNIGWQDFELKRQLQERSKLPVFVENDANMVALGENWRGSGNNANDLIAITLGTGVGSGIIANGEILSGVNGTAGEIGHTIADRDGYLCNCGRMGCLDTIASATGIIHQAMDKVNENPNSELAIFYHQNSTLTAKDIFELAAKSDKTCKDIIDRIADILGLVIANAAAVINPSKIIIGGGVSNAGDALLNPVTASFKKYSLPRISNECDVRIARLGNDAGIIGAAYLVKQKIQEGE